MPGVISKHEKAVPPPGPKSWTRPAKLLVFQYGIHPLTKVPVPGYLIESTQGRRVLIDTGFPLRAAGPRRAVHWFRVTPEDHVIERLRSIGLVPTDIDWVICSHFDPDHCGGNELFPHAEFFVQRKHYETASSGRHERFEMVRAHWDHPGLRYTLVDGDQEVLAGIWLIETSGHVPGHQSVMVQLQSSRKVLLAIDAVSNAAALQSPAGRVHPFDMDAKTTLRSIAKLRALIRDQAIEQILYGHDAIQWPELLKAPAAYV